MECRIEPAPVRLRGQHDALDHRAHDLAGFVLVGSVEQPLQPCDPLAIPLSELRVQEHVERRRVEGRAAIAELLAFVLELREAGFHGRLVESVLDRTEYRVDLAVKLGGLALAACVFGLKRIALALRLLPERLDEDRDEVGREQSALQAVENPRLDLLARDRDAVVTGSLLLAGRAGVAVACGDRVGAAAAPAAQDSRQQEARAVRLVQGIGVWDLALFATLPIACRMPSCRPLTLSQRSSSTMRNSGTSTCSHFCGGLGRATRFPVFGSFV